MKTRTTESKGITSKGAAGLPPPPAPPSRDANPWKISTPAPPRPRLEPPTVKGGRRGRSPEPVTPAQRANGGQWVSVAVLALMILAGIGAAVSAFETGKFEEAIGPLLVAAFAVFVLWRRLRRRQELSARAPRDS